MRGERDVVKGRYSPYSGTCPVPLFRRRRTRLPPDLISSMALEWLMSRVLSPLISMIWSPTWTSQQKQMCVACLNGSGLERRKYFYLLLTLDNFVQRPIKPVKVWKINVNQDWRCVFTNETDECVVKPNRRGHWDAILCLNNEIKRLSHEMQTKNKWIISHLHQEPSCCMSVWVKFTRARMRWDN